MRSRLIAEEGHHPGCTERSGGSLGIPERTLTAEGGSPDSSEGRNREPRPRSPRSGLHLRPIAFRISGGLGSYCGLTRHRTRALAHWVSSNFEDSQSSRCLRTKANAKASTEPCEPKLPLAPQKLEAMTSMVAPIESTRRRSSGFPQIRERSRSVHSSGVMSWRVL